MDILQKIEIKRDVQLERELASFRRPSLKEALKRPGLQIIGEIKRASPSKGQIAEEGFDLIRQAGHYVNNNIAAFSILTEEEYFKGDNEFIKRKCNKKNKLTNAEQSTSSSPLQRIKGS